MKVEGDHVKGRAAARRGSGYPVALDRGLVELDSEAGLLGHVDEAAGG